MTFGGNFASITGLFQKEDKSGSFVAVPVDVSLGGGGGGDLPTAYADSTLTNRAQWQVPAYRQYGTVKVPLFDDAFTKGPESAAELLMDESKKAMNIARLGLDQALSSDGYGTLGVVLSATIISAGPDWTVVFALQSEILKFRPKMTITQKTTANASTLNSGTGLVKSVNVSAKTMVVTVAGGFTPTAGRFMGQAGTQAASTSFSTWPGIPALIPPPSARPLAPGYTINGVDVSVDEQKLAGSYLDGTNMDALEVIGQLDAMIANVPGAMPDTVLVSFSTKQKIMSDLQTQRRYSEAREIKGPGIDVYFKVVTINGVAGDLNIVGSSNWPDNLIAVLSSKDWVLASPGNKPFVPATASGNPVVEIPGEDFCVVKYRAQAFVYCRAPGGSGIASCRA
jgi:hypothetical protein